jgi:hypothetical protein
VNPEISRSFIQKLSFLAILWLGLGLLVTRADSSAMSAFLQVYFVILLDLVFLILTFWNLFFGTASRGAKTLQGMFFFTFKLVCLALLAITLKRLRNAPTYALALALLFIAVGPLVAGMWSRIQKGNLTRDSKL